MLRNLGPILVCVVVVTAPLPFGSAEPFWGGVWCLLLGVALLIGAPPLVNPNHRLAVWLVFITAVAWCLVVGLQYGPLAPHLPAGPGWEQAGRMLHVDPKVAAFNQIPIVAVVPPLALVLAILAGLIFGVEPLFTPRLYRWVANAGLIYAAYAIFSELTNPTMLLWRQKTAYVDFVTGTFVNHNTAATFFGTIAIIWYARSLREFRRRFDLTRWRDFRYVTRKITNPERTQIRCALAFFVLLATTFMTRSRAGSLLTLVALGLVTLLYFKRDMKNVRRIIAAGIAILIFAFGIIEIVGGQLTNEIEVRGLYDAARADAWISALKIIRDHPLLGTGLGTFSSVFSAYRSPDGGVWGVFDHAHSTPLELLVEMGVPFCLLVFSLWALMIGLLVRASVRPEGNRLYLISGAGIVLLATLHSMIDFSLQIPGFAIVSCALTGASLAQAIVPAENKGPNKGSGEDNALGEPVHRRRRSRHGSKERVGLTVGIDHAEMRPDSAVFRK